MSKDKMEVISEIMEYTKPLVKTTRCIERLCRRMIMDETGGYAGDGCNDPDNRRNKIDFSWESIVKDINEALYILHNCSSYPSEVITFFDGIIHRALKAQTVEEEEPEYFEKFNDLIKEFSKKKLTREDVVNEFLPRFNELLFDDTEDSEEYDPDEDEEDDVEYLFMLFLDFMERYESSEGE